MNKAKRILPIFLVFIASSCIPDRMPPEPIENVRPSFVSFDAMGKDGLNVPLNAPIKMYFDEPMNPQSFQNNLIVKSASGEIAGSFSYGEADSIIIFQPGSGYHPAEYYEISLSANFFFRINSGGCA